MSRLATGIGSGCDDLAMRFTEESSSDATVEEAFAAHIDTGVREQACKESGALSWDVSVTPSGDGVRIAVNRSMPPQVPDFIRKFLGDTIDIRQIEEWSAPDATGTRRADVKLTIHGQPASMIGTAVLKPDGNGSMQIVDGDVKVAIPFLGRRIEPEIAKVVAAALRIEQRVEQDWIRANR
jgi:hypothetical protein